MATTNAWTEWQDAIVKKIYSSQSFAERRRLYKTYQPKLAQYPRSAIYQRAITLGVIQPLRKEPRWCDAEIEIVERYARYTDACIQKHLKKAGFQRTVNAVHVYRSRHVVGLRQGKIDSGIYTACQAAEIVGSSSRTVTSWIEKADYQPSVGPTMAQPSRGRSRPKIYGTLSSTTLVIATCHASISLLLSICSAQNTA